MAFVKRIFLFMAINILVVTMISFVFNLFNIKPYLNAYGLNYQSLLIFCLIWGMGGALISLALSRKMAKWILKVRLVSLKTYDPDIKHLLDTVKKLSLAANLPMPEVGVYTSREVNAFATGPSKNRSLIAVSTGLLNCMKEEEIEAILGHEVSHIANGDMVTMTLLQGIVNAFVMFMARVIAYAISGVGRNQKNGSYASFAMLVFFFEIIFMVLGSMVICGYSRFREYRADLGGAKLAGKDKMIAALSSLRAHQEIRDPRTEKTAVQAFKISNPRGGFLSLFRTHPPLQQRIEKLQKTSCP